MREAEQSLPEVQYGAGTVFNFTTLPGYASVPEIITTTPEVVTTESAQLGGKIISDGGTDIIEKGVYWGTSPNPEVTGTNLKVLRIKSDTVCTKS